MTISLRAARLDDATRLLRWRNDSETRANSLHSEMVPEPEHRAWLERTLAEPDRVRLYIAVAGDELVGTGRLDFVGHETAELSLTIAPEWRGLGFARALIGALIGEAHRIGCLGLTARVKAANARSLRAFLAAGFSLTCDDVLLLERTGTPVDGSRDTQAKQRCPHCAAGHPHRRCPQNSISGEDRYMVWDLHEVPIEGGVTLMECEAAHLFDPALAGGGT